MSWYRFTLTKHAIVQGELDRVMNTFREIFIAAGGPHDLALFGSTDGGGEYFVSATGAPGVQAFLTEQKAAPCAAPVGKQLALVIGDQRALNLVGGAPKYLGT